jgi:hypothetical protein
MHENLSYIAAVPFQSSRRLLRLFSHIVKFVLFLLLQIIGKEGVVTFELRYVV